MSKIAVPDSIQRGVMSRLVRISLTSALAVAFVMATSHALPDVTASHFVANGQADGFVSRHAYMAITSALIMVPLFLAWITTYIGRHYPTLLNIPNRDYWLLPERREAAIAVLDAAMEWFAQALLAFLCYVHWLVLHANTQQPPRLDEPFFIAGLTGFALFTIGWLVVLYSCYRIPR